VWCLAGDICEAKPNDSKGQVWSSGLALFCDFVGFRNVLWIELTRYSGSAASIVRITYVHGIAESYNEYFNEARSLAVWSTIEPGVGITASSMATLRPMFSKWLDDARRFSTTHVDISRYGSRKNSTRSNADEKGKESESGDRRATMESISPSTRQRYFGSIGGSTLRGVESFVESHDKPDDSIDEEEAEMRYIQRHLRGRSIH
jgi:hypothetical protein